eukprot:jgi/Psemu1/20520/gm1.20520_g
MTSKHQIGYPQLEQQLPLQQNEIDMNLDCFEDENKHLLFEQIHEKHGLDAPLTPSETSNGPGPMTQAAAFDLLGMDPAMLNKNVGAELSYSLQSDDENTYAPAIELTINKKESAATRKNGCRNSSSNNNNSTSSTSSSSSNYTRLHNYAKTLLTISNHFNTFGDKGEDFENADANTKEYSKSQIRNHDNFIKLIANATDPAKNDPGDEILYEMFTKKELLNDGLTVDYLFYERTVSGKPNKQSKTIMDQALKIWTTHVTNLKNGKPLDFETHQVYIRKLVSVFHSKGVKYTYNDFKYKGGFKIKDPTFDTKRNKAELDEFVDEKFKKVIDDGTYKPYKDMLDLLKLMTMERGQQFGIQGRDELVYLKWDYLKLGVFANGAMKDLKYIIIAPSGGFCKTNGLNINNPTENEQHPMVVEDPENSNCIIKLIYFYWVRCNESQPKSPVGANTIRKWVREFAQVADFKDWEKYTPHDNRHQCCTILASDHAKSAEPYIHQNSKTPKRVQGGALSSAIDNNNNNSNNGGDNNNKNNNNSINKPPLAPSTKQANIPVPQDPVPAVILGTKKPPPSKDTLKKKVQNHKKDSKELKKENKKQMTKLQDAEEDVDQLTINLKASHNINKTLTNEVNRLHWNRKTLEKEKRNLEQRLEEQKDLHEKELLQQQTKADATLAKLNDQDAKALEDAKKTATKEAADEYKLSKMEDIELKGKQNEISQLHQQMNQNQFMYDPSAEPMERALIGWELVNNEDDNDSVSNDNRFSPDDEDDNKEGIDIEVPPL